MWRCRLHSYLPLVFFFFPFVDLQALPLKIQKADLLVKAIRGEAQVRLHLTLHNPSKETVYRPSFFFPVQRRFFVLKSVKHNGTSIQFRATSLKSGTRVTLFSSFLPGTHTLEIHYSVLGDLYRFQSPIFQNPSPFPISHLSLSLHPLSSFQEIQLFSRPPFIQEVSFTQQKLLKKAKNFPSQGEIFLLLLVKRPKVVKTKERILAFKSFVEIHPSGWINVTEVIHVRSLQQKIRRGIYRDILTFTLRKQPKGLSLYHTNPLEILSVKRNGKKEDYHVVSFGWGKRIYIGKKNRFIPKGEHTYEIRYRTHRHIYFSKDWDELFWNVTGNYWEFPLDKVEAEFLLPKGLEASQVKVQGFTGVKGAKEKDYRIFRQSNRIQIVVTRTLYAGEGLSVSVKLPKGYVQPPSPWEERMWILKDNLFVFLLPLGLFALLIYYLVVWYLFGRDPKPGTIVPLFEPPKGISAAAARYIWNMGWDDQCLTAFFLDMAAKKKLSISEKEVPGLLQKKKRYQILLQDPSSEGLTKSEKITWEKIWQKAREEVREMRKILNIMREEKRKGHLLLFFPKKEDLPILPCEKGEEQYILQIGKGLYNPVLKEAQKIFPKVLEEECKKKYFFFNSGYVLLGILFMLFIYLLSTFFAPVARKEILIFSFTSLFFLLVASLFLKIFWDSLYDWIKGQEGSLISILLSLLISLYMLGELSSKALSLESKIGLLASLSIPLSAFFFLLLHFLFAYLLKAPTRLGRKILDQLEGFRMYLKTAEASEMETQLRQSELSLELFEKYLPYAFALDVLEEWVSRFSSVIEKASLETSGAGVSLGMTSFSSFCSLATSGNISEFAGSFSSSITSSASASSGGGAGGGGGGGGGGGW